MIPATKEERDAALAEAEAEWEETLAREPFLAALAKAMRQHKRGLTTERECLVQITRVYQDAAAAGVR